MTQRACASVGRAACVRVSRMHMRRVRACVSAGSGAFRFTPLNAASN
ncbi:hypothetical protein [Lysobacter gummosus]